MSYTDIKFVMFSPEFRSSIEHSFKEKASKVANKKGAYSEAILKELSSDRAAFVSACRSSSPDVDKIYTLGEKYLAGLRGFFDYDPNANPIAVETVPAQKEKATVHGGDGSMMLTRPSADDEDAAQSPSSSSTAAVSSGAAVSKLRYSIFYFWSTALGSEINYSIADAAYEVACVVYNMCIAVLLDVKRSILRTSLEVKKDCYKKLNKAAGILQYLTNIVPQIQQPANAGVPWDLASNESASDGGIVALLRMVSAQVQEIAIGMALEKEDKQELIAKLSRSTSEKYANALDIAQRAPNNKLDARYDMWINYLQFKVAYYKAYALIYAGITYNKQDKNGEAIACTNAAKSLLESVRKTASKLQRARDMKDATTAAVEHLQLLSTKFSDKFEKENTMIYHSRVPTELPELPEAQSIGVPESFDLPAVSGSWTPSVYAAFDLAQAGQSAASAAPEAAQPAVEPDTEFDSIAPATSSSTQQQEKSTNEKPAADTNDPSTSADGKDDAEQQSKKKKKKKSDNGISMCTLL